jgi:hypothetical protein
LDFFFEKLDETVEDSLAGAALWDEIKDRLHESALLVIRAKNKQKTISQADSDRERRLQQKPRRFFNCGAMILTALLTTRHP